MFYLSQLPLCLSFSLLPLFPLPLCLSLFSTCITSLSISFFYFYCLYLFSTSIASIYCLLLLHLFLLHLCLFFSPSPPVIFSISAFPRYFIWAIFMFGAGHQYLRRPDQGRAKCQASIVINLDKTF